LGYLIPFPLYVDLKLCQLLLVFSNLMLVIVIALPAENGSDEETTNAKKQESPLDTSVYEA
jgi:hypothetical protein